MTYFRLSGEGRVGPVPLWCEYDWGSPYIKFMFTECSQQMRWHNITDASLQRLELRSNAMKKTPVDVQSIGTKQTTKSINTSLYSPLDIDRNGVNMWFFHFQAYIGAYCFMLLLNCRNVYVVINK